MSASSLLDLFGITIPLKEFVGYVLDEHIDQRIVKALRERRITVWTIEELGLKGEKDDRLPLARATALGCVFVTRDHDFGQINQEINALWPEAQHAGIIFVSKDRSPGKLIADLVKLHQEWTPDRMHNVFWTI